MLKLDARHAMIGRDEADPEFGDEIRIETPFGIERPGENDAARRLPVNDMTPWALAAIDAALEPASADTWLDDDILLRRGADRMAFGPPAPHAGGENFKGTFGRGLHLNCLAH